MPRNILQNAQLFNFHMFGGDVDVDGEEGRQQKHFFVSFQWIDQKDVSRSAKHGGVYFVSAPPPLSPNRNLNNIAGWRGGG